MKKTETIKENRTFRQIYRRGRSAVTPFLVLYCRPNRLGRNRLGITVSTKLGGAVVRNRARRRLREVYRLAQPNLKQGYDLVLVARARSVNGPYVRLAAAFDRACAQLGLRREGVFRRHCRSRSGQWRDLYWYGLLEEDYLAERGQS